MKVCTEWEYYYFLPTSTLGPNKTVWIEFYFTKYNNNDHKIIVMIIIRVQTDRTD